jgi:hypothetical protein
MDTGESLDSVRDRVLSANAYIGSTPIVEALARGANVVVTGRSTDTALTMAPLRHEFGWGAEDWDQLAAGIVAGHILECGAQCSGGNCLHDWRSIPDLANVGYPIAEASADGSFVVTKHPGTGGRVSFHSVAEQLVYEMGDPRSYITPDVVADFTSIRLEEVGPDRVRVHGITGKPATDKLKVSIAYRSGWKAVGTLVYAWPEAMDKARLADRVLRERLDRLGLRFDEVLTEFVGASATHGRSRARRRRTSPRCSSAWACAGRTARWSSASRARSRRSCSTDRRASPGSPAGARRSRRSWRTGPRSSTRRWCRRAWRCCRERRGERHGARPPARRRARPLGRQGRHRQRGPDRAPARVVRGARPARHARARRRALPRRDHRRRDALRAPEPAGAQLPVARGARRRRHALAQDRRQGKVYSTALLRLVLDVPRADAERLALPTIAAA